MYARACQLCSTLTSGRIKREERKISAPRIIPAKDTPPNDTADDNSRGRGPKSSLKNKRARYAGAFSHARSVRVARHDSRKRVVVIVPNITIAAKLQRPVLLARERPRAPQNHNTTPYKIQYTMPRRGPSSASDGNNLFKPPPPKLINCYTCPSSACYFSG